MVFFGGKHFCQQMARKKYSGTLCLKQNSAVPRSEDKYFDYGCSLIGSFWF